MKNQFIGYYQPTSEEYSKLWEEALIVLDTNVLLSLYKLPVSAREEVIGVLEKVKNRLWIPHHVALEFQRGRLTVIANERKAVDDVLTSTNDLINEVKSKFDTLQIDKRDIGVDCESLLKELDKASEQLVEAIRKAHESQLDISSSDPIRKRIDELVADNVGIGPVTQSELDQLVLDGENRFDDKIPPGFKDADKGKNPADASFIFDGLKYQRKFGDLIIWRQIITHAKDKGVKTVLFITADNKEDWWWREQGKTIGPRQELVREIHREAGVDLFWMYSSVQFVEQANKYVSAKVSKESVTELQNVLSDVERKQNHKIFISHSYTNPARVNEAFAQGQATYFSNPKVVEEVIGNWLKKRGLIIKAYQEFPDFIVERGIGYQGFEVKLLERLDTVKSVSALMDILMRGYVEVSTGNLNAFTLIIVIPERSFTDIVLSRESRAEVSDMLRDLIKRYPVDAIVVGAIIDYNFMVLLQEDGGGFAGDYSYAMSS
ncbi:PIN-like domain-containing protein [Hymenobacter sp. 5317J-9]|uniref:PIN-like domain-containing protein n=1 Tax=Hymenobacter sp. 5317J-9 TaxID=2932250 RepID=UPI001FD69FB7|nr:PIN-like domain-containing protein [Hymenobacter sp. 5317J-9]UOQ97705.1 PIN-like domain-containing protein [Hymenobacter sp. 5317J-9]